MNKVKALILVLFFSISSAHAVDFSEADKQLHVLSSAVGTVLLEPFLEKRGYSPLVAHVLAPTLVLGVGAAKELVDSDFDRDDMKANALGAVLGVGYNLTF